MRVIAGHDTASRSSLAVKVAVRSRGRAGPVAPSRRCHRRPRTSGPGRGDNSDRRGSVAPSRSPSTSVAPTASSPSRLRRTAAVQCPYDWRSASGRPAATTSTRWIAPGDERGKPASRIVEQFGVVDEQQPWADRGRPSRGSASIASPISRWTSAPIATTGPAASDGWRRPTHPRRGRAASPRRREQRKRRAAAASCRSGDDHVLARGDIEPQRLEAVETHAERHTPSTFVEPRRRGRSPGLDRRGQHADGGHPRRRAGRRARGRGATSCTAAPSGARAARPASIGGTESAAHPAPRHRAGSCTCSTSRSAHRDTIGGGTSGDTVGTDQQHVRPSATIRSRRSRSAARSTASSSRRSAAMPSITRHRCTPVRLASADARGASSRHSRSRSCRRTTPAHLGWAASAAHDGSWPPSITKSSATPLLVGCVDAPPAPATAAST